MQTEDRRPLVAVEVPKAAQRSLGGWGCRNAVKATLRETKSLNVAFTDLRQAETCGGWGTGCCWGG